MQNVILKKRMHKLAADKMRRTNLRALARSEGIPQFMLRLAQACHVKIFQEQAIPKYRHD